MNSTETVYEFVELEAAYLGCKSVGGNPQPKVRIYKSNPKSEYDVVTCTLCHVLYVYTPTGVSKNNISSIEPITTVLRKRF